MAESIVGIRDLKARLSSYLREVKAGSSVLITERGRLVGRIVPEPVSSEDRLKRLVEVGLADWSGRKPPVRKPSARLRGSQMISDLLLEDRD